MHLFSQRIWLF